MRTEAIEPMVGKATSQWNEEAVREYARDGRDMLLRGVQVLLSKNRSSSNEADEDKEDTNP